MPNRAATCFVASSVRPMSETRAIDLGHGFEMLDAERAGTGTRNFHLRLLDV
jgi:hypothetical protein